ncbi:MAG: ATP-binding protein, partial [Cyanobacteria bacterium J06623_7]
DRLTLHKTEIDLKELITTTANQFKIAATARGIELVQQLPEKNQLILVDVNLLQRAIENLLSNALKFSFAQSKIVIQLSYDPVSATNRENRDRVQIRVLDEGIGIKPELRQQVFEAYNTGTYARNVNQIGLGLHFCRMVIKAHQGKILIEDNKPQGTIMAIDLPLSAD